MEIKELIEHIVKDIQENPRQYLGEGYYYDHETDKIYKDERRYVTVSKT